MRGVKKVYVIKVLRVARKVVLTDITPITMIKDVASATMGVLNA